MKHRGTFVAARLRSRSTPCEPFASPRWCFVWPFGIFNAPVTRRSHLRADCDERACVPRSAASAHPRVPRAARSPHTPRPSVPPSSPTASAASPEPPPCSRRWLWTPALMTWSLCLWLRRRVSADSCPQQALAVEGGHRRRPSSVSAVRAGTVVLGRRGRDVSPPGPERRCPCAAVLRLPKVADVM